jgi:hypothetical protein
VPRCFDGRVDVTGWMSGQVFLQTVDENEVSKVSAFLASRGLASQVMTMSEQMVLDPAEPASAVTTTSYSIMVQLGGFPQMVSQVLADLMQRAHGGSWELEDQPES